MLKVVFNTIRTACDCYLSGHEGINGFTLKVNSFKVLWRILSIFLKDPPFPLVKKISVQEHAPAHFYMCARCLKAAVLIDAGKDS